jgi:hypothetical protein
VLAGDEAPTSRGNWAERRKKDSFNVTTTVAMRHGKQVRQSRPHDDCSYRIPLVSSPSIANCSSGIGTEEQAHNELPLLKDLLRQQQKKMTSKVKVVVSISWVLPSMDKLSMTTMP